jgi:hypothetical protein
MIDRQFRSRAFFDQGGVAGFTHRAFTKSMGALTTPIWGDR